MADAGGQTPLPGGATPGPLSQQQSSSKAPIIYICGGTILFSLRKVVIVSKMNKKLASCYSLSIIYFNRTAECHTENEIRSKDAIRCRDCGYRILYKKRTKRSTLSLTHICNARTHPCTHHISVCTNKRSSKEMNTLDGGNTFLMVANLPN